MIKIQLIILSLIALAALCFKLKFTDKEYCINLQYTDRCFHFSSDYLNPVEVVSHNYIVFNDFKNLNTRLGQLLNREKSTSIIEIDLGSVNYQGFISILDLCIKKSIHQLVIDSNLPRIYLLIDKNPKFILEPFSGCFYLVNSDTLDFNLPFER
jgi:hypothetical protein